MNLLSKMKNFKTINILGMLAFTLLTVFCACQKDFNTVETNKSQSNSDNIAFMTVYGTNKCSASCSFGSCSCSSSGDCSCSCSGGYPSCGGGPIIRPNEQQEENFRQYVEYLHTLGDVTHTLIEDVQELNTYMIANNTEGYYRHLPQMGNDLAALPIPIQTAISEWIDAHQ